MFFNNLNPTILSLGPFEIRYYGLMYVIGFTIAYFLIYKVAQEKKIKITKEDVADFLFYAIIAAIFGSRLFEVIFYGLPYYLENPFEIIAVWHGGLSFHGGLIGSLVAGFIFCRKKKIKFYDMADITMIPLALGLSFGRIGNFINSELVGRITNLPWGVNFNNEVSNGNPVFRHPSQLYESLKNLFIFFTLWFIRKKKLPSGFLFWSFITLYGLLRSLVELVRQPEVMVGPFTMGQTLSIPMFLIGLFMLSRLRR